MNFKRVLSLLLVCVTLCGTVLTVSAARDFYDLPSSHWAYANVQTLVADGTINGYEDGSFQPDAKVTRAEFVKMIAKPTWHILQSLLMSAQVIGVMNT